MSATDHEPAAETHTLWHGRFEGGPDAALMAYTVSLPFDRRMWRDDIAGSRAHVRGLARVELLTDAERDEVLRALDSVSAEMENGSFVFVDSDEDIHTAVERRVTELAGPAGAKLHTARSRNDQVATDLRLWCKRELVNVAAGLIRFPGSAARAGGCSRSHLPAGLHPSAAGATRVARASSPRPWVGVRPRHRSTAGHGRTSRRLPARCWRIGRHVAADRSGGQRGRPRFCRGPSTIRSTR